MDGRGRDHDLGHVQQCAQGAGGRVVQRIVGAGGRRTGLCGTLLSVTKSGRAREPPTWIIQPSGK
jgi:hypothetical protein